MVVVHILYLTNYHANRPKIINAKIWIVNRYNSQNVNSIQNIAILINLVKREHVIIMIKPYVW